MNQNMEKMISHLDDSSREDVVLNSLKERATSFLGEENIYIEQKIVSEIINETSKEIEQIKENMEKGTGVTYDKYKNGFNVGNENGISIGKIVSSRRWRIDLSLPENLEKSGDGKKVRKLMTEAILKDHLFKKLNKVLALNLFESTKKKDASISKGYDEIAKRSDLESKQLGIFAEQIIIGVLEGISIDHSDLGFDIIEANAYQDMNNKIDFIIHAKEKRKGVGINRLETEFKEKSIGIQFTTNKEAFSRKADQISTVKERGGISVDDIIYVDLDKKILQKAVTEWENSNRPIYGPWKFLSSQIKKEILENLLNDVLNDEQKKALQRIVERE